MQNYVYDGFLKDSIVPDLMFTKMIYFKKGTVRDAFEQAVDEILSDEQELIFDYAYSFEYYIDDYFKSSQTSGKVSEALNNGMREYLFDCLKANLYTFLENRVEAELTACGFSGKAIESIRSSLLRFVEYQSLETKLDVIAANVERFAITLQLP